MSTPANLSGHRSKSHDLSIDNKQCLVSVLMAAHNAEPYLNKTLESLLAQTLQSFELIVVDDASTDRTSRILQEYATRDPRVLVLRNHEKRGLPFSLNRGLERCQAALVARADADDLYDPNRLSLQYDFMTARPDIGVVSCGYHRIDEEGRRLRTQRPLTGCDRIRFHMMFENCLLHPGVMFRAELVRKVGGYDPAFWTAQDSDLWTRLLPITRIENLQEPLVSYRVHLRSIMKTRGVEGRRVSIRVPRRTLSAYLQRDLSEEETAAIVWLYQSYHRLEPSVVRLGARELRKMLRVVRRLEPPHIRKDFEQKVSDSLLRQADYAVSASASKAAIHSLQAFLWKPRWSAVRKLTRSLAKASGRWIGSRSAVAAPEH